MISVIIPTYNRENTIKRAIESVLVQGSIVSEIIIVDDGSTDKTKEVIDAINDNRIKYIKNDKSLGACVSRNIGIKNSSNDIIAFQDSDDEWHNNKLKTQIKYILEQDYDVVCSAYDQIKDGSKTYIGRNVEDNEIYNELLFENFIGTPTIVGKKQCFLNTLFDTALPRFQDWEIMIRISRIYKVKFINESLVNAYVQNDSITRNNNNAIMALKIIMNKNKENFTPELESVYYRKMGVYSIYSGDVQFNYFIQAYRCKKDLKTFIDFILAKFKLVRIMKIVHRA